VGQVHLAALGQFLTARDKLRFALAPPPPPVPPIPTVRQITSGLLQIKRLCGLLSAMRMTLPKSTFRSATTPLRWRYER
jgi:hypothetical protein